MITATQNQTLVQTFVAGSNEAPHELSKKEIGYLSLMWSLLAMNVMLMSFINNSFTHCM